MGCDAIFFLDSDLLPLSKTEKYTEVIKRIGQPIPDIILTTWDSIGEQIGHTGFYTFNYSTSLHDESDFCLFYVDTCETVIYSFRFGYTCVEFDLYNYSASCSENIFYVDRWYSFLRAYLGRDKNQNVINQVEKIKRLLTERIAPVLHCAHFLAMGDQVALHERIEDLLHEDATIEEALHHYPQLKFFDNENAFLYNEADDDTATFLYNVRSVPQ